MRGLAFVVAIVGVVVVSVSGCGASKGEGVSVLGDLITVGPSQAARDEIAAGKAALENAIAEDESAAKIEQGEKDGVVRREALGRLALAAVVAMVAVGVGFGGKLAAPLAREAVAGLEAALDIRRARRLEISVEVSPGGYSGHLLAEGYDHEELAEVVSSVAVIDGPRVVELQERIGHRGMKALADRGELAGALAVVAEGSDVGERRS